MNKFILTFTAVVLLTGYAQAAMPVTVPMPPKRPAELSAGNKYNNLKWMPPKEIQGKVAPLSK